MLSSCFFLSYSLYPSLHDTSQMLDQHLFPVENHFIKAVVLSSGFVVCLLQSHTEQSCILGTYLLPAATVIEVSECDRQAASD